jgi:hypothetical protein
MNSERRKKICLNVIRLLLFLIGLEVILRYTDLNLGLLQQSLYLSPYDYRNYEVSQNGKLLYSPKPGSVAEYDYGLHELETKYKVRNVTINQLGFRSPEWKAKKDAGVFRIFILGGSNTYGASVSNEDTYPQKLNDLLNKEKPGKFQVWNGGITAAVLSQSVEYARYAMKNFEPDLIIIQDFGNFGRRPFLNHGKTNEPLSPERKKLFEDNPELYLENIPLLFIDNETVTQWHYWLLLNVQVYRFAAILFNNLFVRLDFPHNLTRSCHQGEVMCELILRKYSAYADAVSLRELKSFVADYPGAEVLLFDPFHNMFCNGKGQFQGLPAFSLCASKNLSSEYRVDHPPAYVYDLYATEIKNFLEANSYIPKN